MCDYDKDPYVSEKVSEVELGERCAMYDKTFSESSKKKILRSVNRLTRVVNKVFSPQTVQSLADVLKCAIFVNTCEDLFFA